MLTAASHLTKSHLGLFESHIEGALTRRRRLALRVDCARPVSNKYLGQRSDTRSLSQRLAHHRCANGARMDRDRLRMHAAEGQQTFHTPLHFPRCEKANLQLTYLGVVAGNLITTLKSSNSAVRQGGHRSKLHCDEEVHLERHGVGIACSPCLPDEGALPCLGDSH